MANEYQLNKIEIATLFKDIWGYNAVPLIFGKFPDSPSEYEYEFSAPSDRREHSINGPAFYALNNNGNEMFLPIWLIRPDGSRYLMQNTVSTLTNQKMIVETPLVNRAGTVKEEIAKKDWIINVKGIIVSSDGDYPDQEVSELNEMYELSESLGIENARTALVLGQNEKVVIKSLAFREIKGVKAAQGFEMEMVSDMPFELYID